MDSTSPSTSVGAPNVRHYDSSKTIANLLRQLGLPESVCVKNFWVVNQDKLDWILHDARKAYIAIARAVHPRAIGDDDEQSKSLNRLWDEIQRRFRARTNPKLVPLRRSMRGNQRLRRRGFYSRLCKYERCGLLFLTKNPFKIYCCIKHGQQQGCLDAMRREKTGARIYFRTCAFRHCGRAFKTTDSRKKFHSRRCTFRENWNRWYHRHNALNRKKRNDYRQRVRDAKANVAQGSI